MTKVSFALVVVALAGCPSKSPKIVDTTPDEPDGPPPTAPPPDDDAPAKFTDFDIADNHLVLPGPIVFTDNELDLEQSDAALRYVRDFLVAKDDVTLVRIEGHSDVGGEDSVNYSGALALDVGNWLIGSGIACERMLIAAFGDWKPIAPTDTAEGRAQNRRIDVVIAELRGKPIGGMPVDGGAPASVTSCP